LPDLAQGGTTGGVWLSDSVEGSAAMAKPEGMGGGKRGTPKKKPAKKR
jgi:hypothetical protein